VRIGKEKAENIFHVHEKNRVLGEKGEKPRTRVREPDFCRVLNHLNPGKGEAN